MTKKKRRATPDIPPKAFARLEKEVIRLRKSFETHVNIETPQWEEAVAGVGRIEKSLTEIEINGDGTKYTLQGAFHYLADLLKGPRRRFKFTRKWAPRAERAIEWMFASKVGRTILFFGTLYLTTSLMEDFGIIHQNALKLAWNILTRIGQ